MNVPVYVRRGDLLRENIIVDEIFGALRAVFQHGPHGRVGVDVSVLVL